MTNSDRQTSIESAVVHTFGTFVFVSYGYNLFVTNTLLRSYVLAELDVMTKTVIYPQSRSVDLNATYFGPTHAPYAALGILGGFVTTVLPLVLVLIFPTRLFPKLIMCCGSRRWHAIRTFLEVFTGSYEDGTGNKRDYRFFSALYLFGQMLTFYNLPWFQVGTLYRYYWLINGTVIIFSAGVIAIIKPRRKWSHNMVDMLILLLMGKINIFLHIAFKTSISEHTLRFILIIIVIDLAIPQVVLMICFCFKTLPWMCSRCLKRDHASLRGVDEIEGSSQVENGGKETQPLLYTNNSS